ncbi:hypothetical protein EUTSA_v10022208mg [Eutrema salsugineum]|uniref:F-box domain-containing protein n=1 Tax=Eutrema salsugineum TaxID=72664 RepID=V4M5G3_EUTSA|nr:hypothetical protein EUTSA_v10022208mg [Eutrema salsugineum]
MSSPDKKKRKENVPSPTPQSPSNPPLPDDLLISCFARVSRLCYLTLSFVSKRFRSLIASPELYKARSILGNTESCLYLCLASSSDNCWFTLCRKPDKTLTNDTSLKKKSSGYVLARVPFLHSPRAEFSGLVAVGSEIYNIGSNSSSVSAPSMPLELIEPCASVVDGKIYVAGLRKDSLDESFEPPIDIKYSLKNMGDLYVNMVANENVVAYNSKEDQLEPRTWRRFLSDNFCEIENVMYSVFNGGVGWYDTKSNIWRYLKGLVGLPDCVFWGENCEIWGKLEWFDLVVTVPRSYDFVKALAATV